MFRHYLQCLSVESMLKKIQIISMQLYPNDIRISKTIAEKEKLWNFMINLSDI